MDKDRFHALDAVRGMAALAVLVYHLSGQKIFPGAWVAVDLFFVLSGFVIHHRTGWSAAWASANS